MAGRGRGRGSSNSFSREVIEKIGIEGGGNRSESQSETILEPPPLYPPLENHPVPLNLNVEGEYLLALKRDFVEFFHDSPCYLQHTITKTDIERYSDRYQTAALASRSVNDIIHDWTHLPSELAESSVQPVHGKRKLKSKATPSKVAKKSEDIKNRLEELEKREEHGEDKEDVLDAEGQRPANKEGDKEGDSEVEEDIEEEDQDEEMDDGTDYNFSYFDNGENYLDDEDDNLDDGPIY